MEQKECEICKRFVKEKYKSLKIWKTLAIIFVIIAVVLLILYFSSGSVVIDNTVEYHSDVEIENDGGNNANTNNGNVVVDNDGDGHNISAVEITIMVISVIVLLIGGVLIAYAIYNQKSGHSTQSRSNNQQK